MRRAVLMSTLLTGIRFIGSRQLLSQLTLRNLTHDSFRFKIVVRRWCAITTLEDFHVPLAICYPLAFERGAVHRSNHERSRSRPGAGTCTRASPHHDRRRREAESRFLSEHDEKCSHRHHAPLDRRWEEHEGAGMEELGRIAAK